MPIEIPLGKTIVDFPNCLQLSFENGAVIVQLRTNKVVTVTKKGSIIIKDKKK